MKKVVAVSALDRNIDFTSVKESGCAGVIVRAGYADRIDPYYHEYMQGAINTGLPVGIYWESYAQDASGAKEEAASCLELAGKYDVTMPVYWSYTEDARRFAEASGTDMTAGVIGEMAAAFCKAVKKAGYTPGLKLGEEFKDGTLDVHLLSMCSIWYVHHDRKLEDKEGVDLWQYTDKGNISGMEASNEKVSYIVNAEILNNTRKADEYAENSRSTYEGLLLELQNSLKLSYGIDIPIGYPDREAAEAGVLFNNLRIKKPVIKNLHAIWLQDALRALYYAAPVTGKYDPETEELVKVFQGEMGLIVDGIAGVKTHRMLLDMIKRAFG